MLLHDDCLLTDLKSNFPLTVSLPMTGMGGGRACSGTAGVLLLSVSTAAEEATGWGGEVLTSSRGLGACVCTCMRIMHVALE